MIARRPLSLTLRIALSFACVAVLVVGGTGVYLYRAVDDATARFADFLVIGRLENFRKLLRYDHSLDSLLAQPQLFENMMGSERDLFVLAERGKPAAVNVNPQGMMLPEIAAVADGKTVQRGDIQHLQLPDGTPVRFGAASVQVDGRDLQVTVAHVMAREDAMLAEYRQRIWLVSLLAFAVTAALGYLLLRRGLRPLKRMAADATAVTPTTLDSRLSLANTPPELRELTESFNAMLDRLADGYQRLAQFSADLAHEIRTPVGSLMGHCQVALNQARSVEEYQGVLASNLEELERIARIVENILFLARADNAQELVNHQRIPLRRELLRIADYFEGLAQERELTLEVTGDAVLHADPLLLRRAVSNLLANAIRYASHGSVIRLSIETAGNEVGIAVENACERTQHIQLERLFDRFYRGDASRHERSDSNGLGLAITAAIMKLHAGRVAAALPTAERIRFTLAFPALPHGQA